MDPFGLSGSTQNKEQKQRRVFTSPSQRLDKGNFVQQIFGISDEAKEAKNRRGIISDDFRQQRKQAHEEWRKEDQRIKEQDRQQKEDLERYYNVHAYEPNSEQWKDATGRVEIKFERYKKDSKRDTVERRRKQIWDLQRQRDATVRQMWKALRSAGEGEAPRGERLR